MGIYDYAMKVIVDANPEAIVQFVLRQWYTAQGFAFPDDGFKVLEQLSTEFQGREAEADGLLLVELADGQQIMVHIEFQSKYDKYMPDRLLDYCLRARRKHGSLPIITCVIYLRSDRPVEEPPWRWSVTEQYHNLTFDYVCIKLWEIPREDVLALQQPVLLPLALLAKGEVNRIIVKKMFEELRTNKLNDLMLPGQIIAGWLLKESDLEWLKKEYAKMASIFEDSPVIGWIKEDAREKGYEKGREKGREEVREEVHQQTLQKFRQLVLALLAERFPELVHLAKKQVSSVEDQDRLQHLILQISVTQDFAEMVKLLSALDEDAQS
jgi:predicted transposase YdaD